MKNRKCHPWNPQTLETLLGHPHLHTPNITCTFPTRYLRRNPAIIPNPPTSHQWNLALPLSFQNQVIFPYRTPIRKIRFPGTWVTWTVREKTTMTTSIARKPSMMTVLWALNQITSFWVSPYCIPGTRAYLGIGFPLYTWMNASGSSPDVIQTLTKKG